MDYLALNFSLNELINSSLFRNMQDTMKTPKNLNIICDLQLWRDKEMEILCENVVCYRW